MCGMAGRYHASSETPDLEVLQRMVSALGHRGPDGTGFHVEHGIGLGHARLSIIDLDGGAQPIHNESKDVWITYNGEVFNYVELRRMLEARGHRLYTSTDTEVIVHLYEELGDRFLEELNGQFAFALWDRRRKRLVLVRDRAGILPLYYARIGDDFIFASEVKAILASGYVDAALDANGLDELMTFWAPVAPRTVFRGINQLGPGEVLILEEGRETRRPYWRWQFPAAGEHRRGDERALRDELSALLGDAIAIRLRADVPVGAYLSGGLDSSSLVALLKERLPHTLQTFSIGFDDAGLDESTHQRTVVDHLRTTHHHVQCTLSDIARVFPKTIRHSESP